MAAVTSLKLGKTMEEKLHSVGIQRKNCLRSAASRRLFDLNRNIRLPVSSSSIIWSLRFAVWK